ncbi:MAG TPA: arginine--tRNA ligase [Sedimentisphaerales bacterium]|nr:arginine--tRNA ligase [Sedimentisphaerales bacterium]
MKAVIDILEERITAAMAGVTGREGCPAVVRPAVDPRFGDYQANGIMAAAKKMQTKPRKLAELVAAKLDLDDLCEPPEIAGPGFINLRLKREFVADRLLEINADHEHRLGIEKVGQPKIIVVDFSGPNIAKQMHVGHLRSTIIGDCICRLLEFLGHKVIRQNHIGDWGTNFGMVILGLWHVCMGEEKCGDQEPYYQTEMGELRIHAKERQSLRVICQCIRDRGEKDWREDSKEELGDGRKFFKPFLERLEDCQKDDVWPKILLAYQYVNLLEETVAGVGLMIPTRKKKEFHKEDERSFDYVSIPYESLSRHVTACYLQNIDDEDNEQEKRAWKRISRISVEDCQEIYDVLGVNLTVKDVRGESFYKDMLRDVVQELKDKGLAENSKGAVCVFPEGFKNKEGEHLPFIVQKSDKAYLYATTDLAAIRYRINELKAQGIVYVTDARQKLHFEMLFAVARMAKWVGDDVDLVHVMFGSVLGENGRPLKTRAGENVKLKELLDEAVERAKTIVEQKNPDLPAKRKDEIAKAVGIGAVKYADFSNNRTSDYVFSFEKMLAMDGNTAPYMQYAYARIKSIERKGQSRDIDIETELAGLKKLNLTEPDELSLAKYLLRFGEAIQAAVEDYRPNYLTAYLYELAQKFSAFYTNCPVLDAPPDKRPTRLLLCDLTAKTIKHGLTELLGIQVVEQM